jgi:hypothetical protein
MKYFLLLLVAFSLAACESSEEKELKEFVSSQFKDPQSTQFQKLVHGKGVLCGEINAKNGFGAYVGFKKFVVVKRESLTVSAIEDELSFNALRSNCNG